MKAMHRRTFAKTISWRTTATLDTFAISYFVTGSAVWASSIAGIEVVTKIVIYYVHERVWERIGWGLVV